ncbi:MAG: type II toxin-antitoxin system RelE/ParE family toxin [Ruminococcus sp.]|nr:type II toxin-antitoxin system RelE/ParE family toxin [Ruminococcus sp.]
MRIRISPYALNDLKEIKDYISQNLGNPIAAKRTVKNISNTYKRLADQPYIGTILEEAAKYDMEIRYLVSGNYLIFYQVGSFIEIYRIIYGRRDYCRLLFGSSADADKDEEDTK